MTAATLLSDHGRPAIRIERHLPDPPDNVWRALTSAIRSDRGSRPT